MPPTNEGPPDLDEILRKLQQKISAILGFRGRGSAPGGGNSNAAVGGGVAFVVLLIVAVWLASGFYIVDEGRRGVVLRLGKYLETTMPGPRWHIPLPIESVEVVNVSQVRTVEIGYRGNPKNKQPQEALMLTDDENIVDVQFAVQYTLKSPEDWLFNNKSPDDKVNLQNVQAPEQVLPAFEDVVRSQQDRERFRNEGQAYANDVVPKARGIAARLIEEANGYRQSVISTAQGDASRFRQILAEYEKAPQVTRERIYLDTMQQVFSATSKVVVDQKGGQNLLMLPLERIMQMASQAASAASDAQRAAAAPEATQSSPVEAIGSRRDSLRSRDRESGR